MTLQQCKYVIEISKTGSISKAAKRLFVAQSSLSESVKSLEKELGIELFERNKYGVRLTAEGAEFIRYANMITSQADFIMNRYSSNTKTRLYISTQHYDFVADIFSKMIKSLSLEEYDFALSEKPTYEVIKDVENSLSDIGILAIKSRDELIMKRYLYDRKIIFNRFLKTYPHAYIRKDHPLASKTKLTFSDVTLYPYVSYDQGENNTSFFEEEIFDSFSKKHIQISDRATLMNILLGTDGYTIGTGIMPSALNDGKIVSIPYESDNYYIIGYIIKENRKENDILEQFITFLTKRYWSQ